MRTVIAPRKISVERAGVECNIPLFLQENCERMTAHVREQVLYHERMLNHYKNELEILEQLNDQTRKYNQLETQLKEFLRDR